MTPLELELQVRILLESLGHPLIEFQAKHRERMDGLDGRYEIDVMARFRALNVQFVVLAECKMQSYPIKRQVVQILHSKVQSVGAHKGIIYSTSDFQSGAIEFAIRHGIALVKVFPEDYTPTSPKDEGSDGFFKRIRKLRPIKEPLRRSRILTPKSPMETKTIVDQLNDYPWICSTPIIGIGGEPKWKTFRHFEPVALRDIIFQDLNSL